MPERLAILDQEGLGARVLYVHPLGQSQGERPLLDDPDKGKRDTRSLGRFQKCFPLTVGSCRDRSGSRVLEDQNRAGSRLSQDLIQVGRTEQMFHFCQIEKPPYSALRLYSI